MHGQTYNLGRNAFAHGLVSFSDGTMPVRLLAMQRDRVINGSRNALCLQGSRQPGKKSKPLNPDSARTVLVSCLAYRSAAGTPSLPRVPILRVCR